MKKIGEGSYGDVYKCLDLETNNYVAVKIFRDKYLKEEDLARGASPPQFDIRKIALREIKMLRVSFGLILAPKYGYTSGQCYKAWPDKDILVSLNRVFK